MELMDRAKGVKESFHRRRSDAKLEAVGTANAVLRGENRALREALEREHSALEKLEGAIGRRRPHRVRRLLTLGVTAGGAYIVGTKAATGGYDQLRDRFFAKKSPWDEADIREDAATAVVETGARMSRATERAGDSIKRTATHAGEVAQEEANRASESLTEGAARAGRKIAGRPEAERTL
jgi:hypothetical protein